MTKLVVGSFPRGVIEVVGPRIEGHLRQEIGIKPRLLEQVGIGFVQDFKGRANQFLVRTTGKANTLNVEWYRSDPFVLVGLHCRFRFEHGYGTISDVIV